MNSRQSHIIKKPIITEKSAQLSEAGKYTFEVAVDANKIEIAQAVNQLIEEIYPKNKGKSKVVSVNTSAMRGRFRRSRRHGRAPHDSKKAIVTIEGEPLDFFGA